MLMDPKTVGASDLPVDETKGWLPKNDLRAPTYRYSVNPQTVVDKGTFLDVNPLRGKNLEVKPRWSQCFEIHCIREVTKNVLSRAS